MASNLKITSTVKIAGQDDSVYVWDGVDDKKLAKIQRGLINTLSKVNDAVQRGGAGLDGIDGKDVGYSMVVTKADGSKYTGATFDWPRLPANALAFLKGVLGGEMSAFDGEAKKHKGRGRP